MSEIEGVVLIEDLRAGMGTPSGIPESCGGSEQHQSFQALVDQLPDALFVQADDVLLYVNGKFCELVGRTGLTGTRLSQIVAPRYLASVTELLQRTSASTGEQAARECRFIRPDGTTVQTDLRASPVTFDGRQAVACTVRDLSEWQSLEARLMLADRMASVGTLAAGVAHEINNPLAFVVINLAFVAEQLEHLVELVPTELQSRLQVPEILEAIGEAQEGSQRVRRIVNDLRTFAQGGDDRPEPVNLSQVIETCISMAGNEIRHRAQLERQFEEVPPVDANRARLAHVFLNLIVNAAQAIEVGNAEQNRIRIAIRRHGANAVRVSVTDSGVGIPPAVLPRIFDPFFTTKPVGVGTGLGLSICHSTITSMGGTITVESEPGRGSTFCVELPLHRVTDSPPRGVPAPLPLRRGRVLVIDDEQSVGSALRRALRSHHDVDYFVSAREALTRLEAAGDTYDVILCDLMMPDMSGIELYSEIQRRLPQLSSRLVFFTGGAFVPEAQAFLDRNPNRRVEKPLDLNLVKNLIQELMVEHGSLAAQES